MKFENTLDEVICLIGSHCHDPANSSKMKVRGGATIPPQVFEGMSLGAEISILASLFRFRFESMHLNATDDKCALVPQCCDMSVEPTQRESRYYLAVR